MLGDRARPPRCHRVHCIERPVLVARRRAVVARRVEQVLVIERRVLVVVERREIVGLRDDRAERPAGSRGVA